MLGELRLLTRLSYSMIQPGNDVESGIRPTLSQWGWGVGVRSAYSADQLLDVSCVSYAHAEGGVALRAARFDVVVLVGEVYSLVDRVERYRELGVEVHVYPLPATVAPTMRSVLGLLAWLEERCLRGERVLVEGTGGHSVVAVAHMVARGVSVGEALAKAGARGFHLLSPLQLRLAVLLDYARRGGVDLLEAGRRWRCDAFTGGDAHLSTVAELALEHALCLDGLLPLSPPRLFEAVEGRARLTDAERLVLEASRSLDHTYTGAVKNVALAVGEKLEVLVGCELVYREEQCWPEAEAAMEAYQGLARMLGLDGVVIGMEHPETLACRVYGVYDPGMCGDEE